MPHLYNAVFSKVRAKAEDTRATETDCVLCKLRTKAEEKQQLKRSVFL